MPQPTGPLYDPCTADRIRREQIPTRLLVFGLATLVAAGLCAALHHELPFLAYWTGACSPEDYVYECEARTTYDVVAGVAGFALFGAFCLLAHRLGPIRPTLRCRRCSTSGWVLDIEPHEGRCPRCGGDRFDYRIWHGGVALWHGRAQDVIPSFERVDERDVAGADLVRRFRETRKSAMHRYD